MHQQGWKLDYDELFGPEGYMMKFVIKHKVFFGIYIATDLNISGIQTEQVRRSQYWTLAHETGHILLHGGFILNSSLDENDQIDEQTKGILEVEAHWFAARLLMPDYIFRNYWDLEPQRLAEKCQVNITPAQKRIEGLSPSKYRYVQSVEPWQVTEQRINEQEKTAELLYGHIWKRNNDMIDKWRRKLGYE